MPNGPKGKASAVAPKLSDDDHVELEDMLPTGPEVSPEEDIMQLARLGDIQAIERLYDSGKYEPSYCDPEGITPLHVCNRATPALRWISLMLYTVGCHQQPICDVPIPPESRS
jgi:ankyrin repeat protein